MSDTKYFSQEYQPESQTGITEIPLTIETIEQKEASCTKDFEKYGVSKPYRIVVKAKLVNDQN